MTPGLISKRIMGDRLAWVERMIEEIRSLPLNNYQDFSEDRRNFWAAESCLRRGLEALFDIGRHILARGFATGVSEYKEIAQKLGEIGVLSPSSSRLLRLLAGYRNRLAHFYHEVSAEELYRICKEELGDLQEIKEAYMEWLKNHPEKVNEKI